LNGDLANKIGTYSLAVLAHHHQVPFFCAAPTSTINPAIADGSGIVIEERPSDEMTMINGL
jgi:methylthioribose-1-phosphate isomerase